MDVGVDQSRAVGPRLPGQRCLRGRADDSPLLHRARRRLSGRSGRRQGFQDPGQLVVGPLV